MVKWRHNRENIKNLNYTNYICHDYKILTITIQFRPHEGQLISRIQKTDKRYILGQGKNKTKTLEKVIL